MFQFPFLDSLVFVKYSLKNAKMGITPFAFFCYCENAYLVLPWSSLVEADKGYSDQATLLKLIISFLPLLTQATCPQKKQMMENASNGYW